MAKPHLAYFVLLVLGTITTPASALSQQTAPAEAALPRSRVASALRDSTLKLSGDIAIGFNLASVPKEDSAAVAPFLINPFDPTASVPSMDQLDRVLTVVNAQLKAGRDQQAGDVGGEQTDPGAAFVNAAVGAVGLPTQAHLVVGLTDFMIERAKDEVAFSFVLNLRNNVGDDLWIRVGLPRSYRLMQRIDYETYQAFLPLLRSAFIEDFNSMPSRINVLADSLKIKEEYLQGIAIAYQRGLEIRQGAPPAVALTNLLNVDTTQMPNGSIRQALHMVGMLSREYSAGGGEPFIQEITKQDRGWMRRYLLAFVTDELAKFEGLDPESRTRLMQFMASRESDAIALLNQLHSTRNIVANVPHQIQSGEKDANDALDRVLAASGAVLEILNTGQRFFDLSSAEQISSVQKYREFVTDANTLHQAFLKRDYGTLVTWVMQRPELRVCDFNPPIVTRRSVDGEPSTRRDDEERRSRQASQADTARQGCATRLKFLSFAASLAGAGSAREVTIALRNASAPVGSYRAKRNQFDDTDAEQRAGFLSRRRWVPQSVSVVGYLGITGGLEDQGQIPFSHTDAAHFGVALPVGIEVSTGAPFGAFSLFAPILDLGTLASARFGEDDIEANSPSFGTVFAPGIFAVFNLSRSFPISLGLGLQSVPDLREQEGKKVDVVRASAFVGIDATLFHFRF